LPHETPVVMVTGEGKKPDTPPLLRRLDSPQIRRHIRIRRIGQSQSSGRVPDPCHLLTIKPPNHWRNGIWAESTPSLISKRAIWLQHEPTCTAIRATTLRPRENCEIHGEVVRDDSKWIHPAGGRGTGGK
jgi:hypothetical protein